MNPWTQAAQKRVSGRALQIAQTEAAAEPEPDGDPWLELDALAKVAAEQVVRELPANAAMTADELGDRLADALTEQAVGAGVIGVLRRDQMPWLTPEALEALEAAVAAKGAGAGGGAGRELAEA